MMRLRQMFEILNQTYYGNTLFQWIFAMLIILASAVASKIVIWLVGESVKTIGKKLGINLEQIMFLLRKPLGVVIILIGIRFATRTLNILEALRKSDIKLGMPVELESMQPDAIDSLYK